MRRRHLNKWTIIASGIIVVFILIIGGLINPFIKDYFSPFSYQQGTISTAVMNNPNISVINGDSIQWDPSTKILNYLHIEPDYFGSHDNIYIDSNGRIWSPSDGWGLFMIENDKINHWWSGEERTYSDAIRGMDFVGNQVYSIHSGSDSGILGTLDVSKMQWEYPWKGNNNIRGKAYSYQMVVDSKNILYIASDKYYLNVFDHGKWSYIKMPCRGRFEFPLYVDIEDNIWIYSDAILKNETLQFGEWLFEYTNGKWNNYDIYNSTVIGDYANTIELDPFNRIWIAFNNSILVLENNIWRQIPSERLPFNGEAIAAIKVDAKKRYWFITKSYMGIYNGLKWQIVPSNDFGLENWGVSTGVYNNIMVFDKNGALWFGSLNNVYKYTGSISLEPRNSSSIGLLNDAKIINIIKND